MGRGNALTLVEQGQVDSAIAKLPNNLVARTKVEPIHGGPGLGNWEKFNHGYGVEFCRIPKTGSTITIRILCDILNDYKGIPQSRTQKVGKTISHFENECVKNNNYLDHWETKWNRPLLETVKFVTVREPVERFVSTYEFLCVHPTAKWCPPSIRNIHQFARWIYHFQKREQDRPDFLRTKKDDYILFHTWPQTSFCEMMNGNQILVHHTRNRRQMQREMMKVFMKAHVPEKVAKRALRHLLRSTTRHASPSNEAHKKKMERAVRQTPQTMEFVRAMYHEDFQFFKNHNFH